MTVEQKAEAYDKALERARVWKDKSGMPKDKQGILDDIFPELKEVEDERIRKWLLDFVQGLPDEGLDFKFYNLNKEQVIAWLERQGDANKE